MLISFKSVYLATNQPGGFGWYGNGKSTLPDTVENGKGLFG